MRSLLLLLSLASLAPAASAQTDPAFWRDGFAVPGVYLAPTLDGGGSVLAFAGDGAGGLYAAGSFLNVDGVTVQNVARWSGAGWVSIGGMDGSIRALLRTSDGALVAAGNFTEVVQPGGGTVSAGGIARWDGGEWSGLGELVGDAGGDSATGLALAEADGVLYVGGQFSSVVSPNGSSVDAPGLARWTGSEWEAFGGPGAVRALEALPNGDLVVGNTTQAPFLDAEGQLVLDANAIARWNGSSWSPVAHGIDGSFGIVEAIEATGGTTFAVGGSFGFVRQEDGSMLRASNVVLWTGSEWEAIGGLTDGSGIGVRALAQTEIGLVAAGGFRRAVQPDGADVEARSVARWTGQGWEALPGAFGEGEALMAYGGGVAVGWYSGGIDVVRENAAVRANGLAAYGADGWRPLSARFDGAHGIGPVDVVEFDPCGDLVAGGSFRSAGAEEALGLAKWDGAAWSAPWGGVTSFGSAGSVLAVSFESECSATSSFYAGGTFDTVVGPGGATTDADGVAYWDGTAWSPLGRGVFGGVSAFAQTEEGVYVGGTFAEVFQPEGGRLRVGSIARWDGAGWEALGEGLRLGGGLGQPIVFALDTQDDGRVVVGGWFAAAANAGGGEVATNGLAVWSPEAGWEAFGSPSDEDGIFEKVTALVRTEAGFVVGGRFEGIREGDGNVIPARNVALWDGVQWSALGDGLPGFVTALEVDADGLLTAAAGDPYLWTGEAWVLVGGGVAGGGVSSLAAQGGLLYVAGGFDLAGGLPSPHLAAYDVALAVPTEPRPESLTPARLAVAPNPTRGHASVRFETPSAAPVRLAVYDAIGREVAVLHDGPLAEGTHALSFDVADLPAGVYIARLTSPTGAASRTFSVVR